MSSLCLQSSVCRDGAPERLHLRSLFPSQDLWVQLLSVSCTLIAQGHLASNIFKTHNNYFPQTLLPVFSISEDVISISKVAKAGSWMVINPQHTFPQECCPVCLLLEFSPQICRHSALTSSCWLSNSTSLRSLPHLLTCKCQLHFQP